MTILNYRHLLERHGLGGKLFGAINAHPAAQGHRLQKGTIVDAIIITAPSSTKNRERARSGDASDEEGQPVVLVRVRQSNVLSARLRCIMTVVELPENAYSA